ncbi:actin related protein 11 [Heterostelium album PN500]|uniref:Actin related protein 11 n=1 Tax=Heterostelium pallidum (strain ATCC 26659 / Pp 5 / PN500) TaxID=670386 RepID=D3BGC8_HETP5|nr:actin related protein 11 [Heterostelium album PN500]EFA79528.1 actin related protein 11 [Heterostelium album PN500]|eukprot:XP_020431649.1 actin related protein 11 [Heterostelium album PN500]
MDKSLVILEIGGAYTKCGYSGESTPRFIIPTDLSPIDLSQYLSSGTPYFDNSITDNSNTDNNNNNNENVKKNRLPTSLELKDALFNFLNRLFYKYLLCKPNEKKIVIVENILMPRLFRQSLASVLFERFKVISILYLSPTVSLLPLLRTTALIIDIGLRESRILPVYEGVGLMKSYKTITNGQFNILLNLKKMLLDDLITKNRSVVLDNMNNEALPVNEAKAAIESLSNNQLEDIAVKTLVVSPLNRQLSAVGTHYQLSQQRSIVISPEVRLHAADILFSNPMLNNQPTTTTTTGDNNNNNNNKDDYNSYCDNDDIVDLLLDTLAECDIDIRKSLTHSILLVGGTSMLPGFKSRLSQEIEKRLGSSLSETNTQQQQQNNRYKQLNGLSNHFEFIKHAFQPNYLMWLGASLVGTLDSFSSHSRITNEQFTKFGINKLPEYEKMTHLLPPTIATSLFSSVSK